MKKTITILVLMLVSGWANAAFDGGDGSIGSPYQVSTAAQLNDVRNFLSSYFTQTADIDLITYISGFGWVPIGNATTKFTGNYDGGGHKIKHLFINHGGTVDGDYSGLFGWISSATIKNLGVECNITGNSNTGGLAGQASVSTIQNCYTTGSIYGFNQTGGLVGYAYFWPAGTISNCYSLANVSGYYYAGGLIGDASTVTLTNCYSTGEVISGQSQKGGLVARNNGCIVSNCFWDTEASGIAISAVGTGKTTAEMKTQSTFTTWNFATSPIVWNIDAENNGYPHLNWQVFTHNKYYVKTTGNNSSDGSSWTNAFLTLQKALETAQSGDQIWVASGTYKPSAQVGGTGARFATFQMVEGVEIYGGFAGTETAVSERLNYGMGLANETILSGDLNGNDNYTVSPWTGTGENCYHIFYHKDDLVSILTPAAILDGFTVKGAWGTQYGGGIYNDGASPTIRNCVITNNHCYVGGGGAFNWSGKRCKPSFINCLVVNNIAASGAGIWNRAAQSLMVNSTIANNTSSGDGSAVWNGMGGASVFNNCILWGNTGGVSSTGKQIYGGATLNYSCYINGTGQNDGTITASNCITTDPQIMNAAANDFRIVGSSPCTDAGNDAYNSLTTDIRGSGFGRKLLKTDAATTGTIDMGVCEYKFGTDPLTACTNASSGGAIAAAQTICNGGNPAAFTSTTPTGQTGTLDYKWQSSTTDAVTEAGFSDISPNGTSETYDPPTGLTVSTWYRRLAKASCASEWLATTAIKVTVRPLFTAGTITTTGESVCYNTTPTITIGSASDASGGDNTITYTWRSSVDAYTAAISGATSSTYLPSAILTATTSYRRYAKDNTCDLTPAVSTGTWTVTVYDVFSSGSISNTTQTICYAGTAAEIGNATAVSGGDNTITYSWRSSDDSYTSVISGATASTYTPPSGLIATTSYRRYAHDGSCNTSFVVSTGTHTVTVYNNFTAGVINSTGETICYNSTPTTSIGTITEASGGDNTISYSWRSSADGYTVAISGATSSTYLPSSILTATTSYRRYAKDNSCNITPEVSTGTWTVTVNSRPEPTISGATSICNYTTANVYTTESGMTSYNWTVIGGTITAGSATNAITVTWNTEGSQSVNVNYANAYGCSAATATTYNITVKSAPFPVITGSPNNSYYVHALDHITYCTPFVTGHLYSWSAFGSISYPSVNRNCIDDYLCNPCGAYGTYTITVSESDPTSGCSVTARKNIYIQTTP
ncbi:MAG: hypothetical protein ACOYOV_13265 [Bacteroidales bacterium]